MMRIIVIIVLSILGLLVGLSAAHGQYLIGQDYLALQHEKFDAKTSIKFIPKTTPTGSLDSTFGTDTSSLIYLLNNLKPQFHRVHIFNGSGVRSQNLGSYDILYGLTISSFEAKVKAHDTKILSYLKKRVLFYKGVAASHPLTKILVSLVLEHNLSKEAWRVLAATAKEVWPDIQLVNSPEGNGTAERYLGSYIERHGKSPSMDADIVSLDGADGGADIDIDAFIRKLKSLPRLKIGYLWTRSYNCRNLGPFQDPRKRTSCPDSSVLELMAHLTDDRGKSPTLKDGVCVFPVKGKDGKTVMKLNLRPLKSPETWKLLAEDKGNGDKRANKPVSITYAGDSSLSIIDFNGQRIGSVGYYGKFGDGLHRHYSSYKGGSGWGGYGFERLLKEKSGSSYGWLKGGNVCIGPFVPGKRGGSFR